MTAFLATLARLFLPIKSRRLGAFVLAGTGKAGFCSFVLVSGSRHRPDGGGFLDVKVILS